MLATFTGHNQANQRSAHAESLRYRFAGVSLRHKFPCLTRSRIGQLGIGSFVSALDLFWMATAPVFIAILKASTPNRIAGVVLLGAKQQVGRIHAGGIVAGVANAQTGWDGLTMREFPRESVRESVLSVESKNAVSLAHPPEPRPAIIWAAFLNTIPESCFGWTFSLKGVITRLRAESFRRVFRRSVIGFAPRACGHALIVTPLAL